MPRREEYSNATAFVSDNASPGFTFGKSGNVPSNTWLLNDTVPSNKSGRAIYLYNPSLEAVYIRVEIAATFDIEIYEHDGTTYTLKHTINVVASRALDTILTSPVTLTQGKELAVKITNGSAKNPVVGCQLRGTMTA